ncbi:MAG: hypothetical protein E3J28_06275 [Desulfobacteraceae bacterium]|nr:MAG: hypothetical protein E3J28_06275 [Desulfobacteraceae bacterium]
MDRNNSLKILPKKIAPIKRVPGEERWLPPWLFQHQDLIHALESANPVDQEDLINTLNHIHFMDRYILIHLNHPKYEESVLVQAYPDPCHGSKLTCRLLDENLLSLELKNYQFLHLVIDDGRSMILVPAVLQEISGNCLTIQLPDASYAVGQRQVRRYACHDVVVELIQSGFLARGELLDFSPIGFRVRVKPESSSSFHWLNPEALVVIHLRDDKQIFFSGLCRCIRQQGGLQDKEIVLIPTDEKIKRFKKRQTRNPRQHLVPSPTIIFNHPFLKKSVQLGVSDISTSGFSVYEKVDEGILMLGMIIPELIIDFAGALRIKCAAQVIYRSEEKEKGIRCGLAILEMDINTYSRLTHILTNALDPHAYISSEVDMDALWEFFFEAGFIYPKKYRLIQSYRKDFKETYRRLYQENPEIACHFTYQKNGRIYGHISMVKAYERAWMIHHHAAIAMKDKRPGLMVLKQIMYYLNDMHRLPSAKTEYMVSYFRPENKFPDRIFGGFARDLKNPRGCSMDLFYYLPYTSLSLSTKLPDKWSLQESSARDLWELNRFYNHYSGGLLLDALDLEKKEPVKEPLEEIYKRLGFLRKWRAYSLNYNGELNAVLVVNQSDLGFNLSELLNGIKILVTNPEDLPWNILSIAIAQLTGIYHMDRVPVLFYPAEYVQNKKVPYEKQYQAWVLDVRYGNEYMEYMQKRFRITYKDT